MFKGLLAAPEAAPGQPAGSAGSSPEGPEATPGVFSPGPTPRAGPTLCLAPNRLRITVHQHKLHFVPTGHHEFKGKSDPRVWKVKTLRGPPNGLLLGQGGVK